MEKRKAAADVFMEQNVMRQQAFEAEELADLDDQEYGAEPAKQSKRARAPSPPPQAVFKTSEELQLEKEPIQVRETGFGPWKRIIIPPNAYVVHTRLGRKDPVTLGLGVSFRYDPYRDAYLVVPAAMQTIGIIAMCISKEKQGINVLAYVQWQIDDFGVAYRKLDFSDSRDPLGIVNAQLREQAEAAIKDKIATMSVEEVLTDKEPVIEELTTRLKAVAEGRKQGEETDEGLGIKIVTVQIKEAYVSSQRLWENLQAPFRNEKDKIARISHLETQDEIRKKELETHQEAETREAQTRVEIERIKESKETEAVEIRLSEAATRFTREQESARTKIALEEETTLTARESEQRLAIQAAQAEQEQAVERTRVETEAEARQKTLHVEQELKELAEEARLAEAQFQAAQQQIERDTTLKQQEHAYQSLLQEQQDRLQGQALEAELGRKDQQARTDLDLEEAANRVRMALVEKQVEVERLRQEIRNLINDGDLASRLVEQLPELAAQMPEIDELRVLQTGGDEGAFDALSTFLAKVLSIAQSMGIELGGGSPRAAGDE
jgi:chemotaxis protein histidine kinase CheA